MKDLERLAGVGREAIRYYIHEGLLPEPERPARNVAWYDESFVDRVLLIKKLQQERYLPLAVIKGIVGSEPVLSHDEARTLADLDATLVPGAVSGRVRPAETVAHLARRVGIPGGEIRKLADEGAIRVTVRGGKQCVAGNGITIVELWGRVRRAGFDEKLGFGVDEVSLYVQFTGWLTREEAKRFARNVTGRVDRETARRMAEEGIAAIGQLLALLREEALLRIIAEGLREAHEEPRGAVGE